MAIQINRNKENTLTIKGTNVSLESVYARIVMLLTKDGQTINSALFFYYDKEHFKLDSSNTLHIKEIETTGYSHTLAPETKQTLEEGHIKLTGILDAKGYFVTTTDLEPEKEEKK